ncbi:protein kinase-like domain-containing protein (mitochondrion) [Artemisia annua]|uniref:non-specific serine/threonine protein kinase n=1 Tax=Artemisia annua TaxID=35608 RepID=A0A2U1PGQ6_ARTAN|nr:protein kinase-like domain-containing protein [Artemisia annua]
MASGSLDSVLSKKTTFMGLKVWVVICLSVVIFICVFLCLLSMWVMCQKKSRRRDRYPHSQIPNVPKDIRVDSVGGAYNSSGGMNDELSGNKGSGKMLFKLGLSKSGDADNASQSSSVYERGHSGEEGTSGSVWKQSSSSRGVMASPFIGLPETSHLGWGHWFTLRDLEQATRRFSSENVVGEGGYGVVYKGTLVNGTVVAVKKLLNNLGQAEKEFRVEVEAIGHVRHKNLVRLLGYCIEGTHRMLVYEYVDNGNLEQWLHGDTRECGSLTWEARMKVLLGIAKALSYLHEAIEPKVVHRDIKSSNILIDHDFNGKLSDFGLAKLLDSGESHINTRVMGTFGYVAPEYANTGMLNEKSDIYSFGVLLLEAVTGRDPVDYNRVSNEINLVEWLKMMVGNRRAEEVVDPNLDPKPSTHALKRALLVALRCVDPDSEKRPKMSQVVRMLDADFPYREERRNRRSRTASMDSETMSGSADIERPAA